MAWPLTIGLFFGTLAGVLGIGGGAITVPALNLFTGLDHQACLGTSLAGTRLSIILYMQPAALAGSIAHYRQGSMLIRSAVPVGTGCLIG